MPEPSSRDRAVRAYTSEVRAFHTFFGAVLLALGTFHFVVLIPYLQIRAALPTISSGMAAAQAQIRFADQAQRVAEAVNGALPPFRQSVAASPERLRRAISDLVLRGRLATGNGGDPYKATIRVAKEGPPSGAPEDETVTVDEAIRRQIGKEIEALGLIFEQALEPIRATRNLPPAVESLLGGTQASVGRDIASLNEILREAFDADPNFWRRWDRPGATFASASPRADEAVRRIESALRGLTRGLAAASTQARSRQQEAQARVESLRARQDELKARAARAATAFDRLPLGLDDATRIYPLVAGALTLTALVRLRRILALRRALAGIDLDAVAPSWVVGSAASPGQWWAQLLVATPLAATIHASVAAITDAGLFASILGGQNRAMLIGYGAAYGLLAVLGVVQFLAVTHGLLTPATPPPLQKTAAPSEGASLQQMPQRKQPTKGQPKPSSAP